ncbi:MAG: amidohydrolase family protein [Solirubrobacterales bacterium]
MRALDESGGFTEPTDVVVEDGLVTAVGGAAPAEAASFDASGLWLTPGIVDCHTHLGSYCGEDAGEMMAASITRWTAGALGAARELLALGITLARDPGSCDAGIRDGIEAGAAPGPTMRVSGTALSQTGGHTDGYVPSLGAEAYGGFFVPEHPNRGPYRADGIEGMRSAVRELARLGVDWIKLCTTGGLVSDRRDHPLQQEFSREEIDMAVAEANRAGIPVCAHAYGGPGLEAAVAAGVRSIEHGLHLTEEQAEQMAQRGCWLVPTLASVEELAALLETDELTPETREKVREVEALSGDQVEVARAAGVQIALGSDLYKPGANLNELPLLHEAGMGVEEVLLTATARGAELLGEGETRGRIAPGYVFDAILLDRDPGELEIFRDPDVVTGVFQAGAAVRPHERWRDAQLPMPKVTIG